MKCSVIVGCKCFLPFRSLFLLWPPQCSSRQVSSAWGGDTQEGTCWSWRSCSQLPLLGGSPRYQHLLLPSAVYWPLQLFIDVTFTFATLLDVSENSVIWNCTALSPQGAKNLCLSLLSLCSSLSVSCLSISFVHFPTGLWGIFLLIYGRVFWGLFGWWLTLNGSSDAHSPGCSSFFHGNLTKELFF